MAKNKAFQRFYKKSTCRFEVAGERDTENPHNKKKYVSLKDNKFKIKMFKRFEKIRVKIKKVYFKINYVTDEQYNYQSRCNVFVNSKIQ